MIYLDEKKPPLNGRVVQINNAEIVPLASRAALGVCSLLVGKVLQMDEGMMPLLSE
jgi:hypothetical protein